MSVQWVAIKWPIGRSGWPVADIDSELAEWPLLTITANKRLTRAKEALDSGYCLYVPVATLINLII